MIRTILLGFFTTFLVPSVLAKSSSDLITVKSNNTVAETIKKFESAVKEKGFMVFTRLDHAAAAKALGLKMPASTVIVFGNPKRGTPNFLKSPTLAIDLPLKALVWEDAQGKVYLSINSASYLFETIYPRHGINGNKKRINKVSMVYDLLTKKATK